jgi:hypothetical protein
LSLNISYCSLSRTSHQKQVIETLQKRYHPDKQKLGKILQTWVVPKQVHANAKTDNSGLHCSTTDSADASPYWSPKRATLASLVTEPM